MLIMQSGSALFFLVFIIAAGIAVLGSKTKWRTVGLILGFCVIGFVVGIVLGLLTRNPILGADLSLLLTFAVGALAALRQIRTNRNPT
jgi:hypothetical protein